LIFDLAIETESNWKERLRNIFSACKIKKGAELEKIRRLWFN
jgi:hypothetical protein